MLETRAIVIQADHRQALVEPLHDASGCGACSGKGCGANKISRMFCSSKPHRFEVRNDVSARSGDTVVIAIADGAVLRGVGLVYLLPLLLMFLGGVAGQALGLPGPGQDGGALPGALLGLVAGFLLARQLADRRARRGGRPYIARIWHGD